ncbi:MAG: helix-turn-helix transcriptional regulator [Clostridia bacterium]|nr:helix-turn-helix transcriptional regulator [Clostridia bacterium]
MLSSILKELRLEKNLSQQQLAKQIGVSQKAIDFWERGINEPKATYIVKLADYFEVSADYLLGRKFF